MEQFLTDITSNPHSPLFIELEELGILKPVCDLKREPVIFVISLMRRNFRSLRSTRSLCSVGYVACLSLLLVVYRKYSKSTMTLFFEDLDRNMYENSLSSLFVGNVPIISVGGHENKTLKPVPCEEENFSLKDCCWNEDLIQLLRVDLSKASTDSEYVDAKENFDEDITLGDDCLEVFTQGPLEGRKSASTLSHVSEDLNSDSDAESYGKSNVFIKGKKIKLFILLLCSCILMLLLFLLCKLYEVIKFISFLSKNCFCDIISFVSTSFFPNFRGLF